MNELLLTAAQLSGITQPHLSTNQNEKNDTGQKSGLHKILIEQ